MAKTPAGKKSAHKPLRPDNNQLLKKKDGGKIVKAKHKGPRPISKKDQARNKAARMALAMGSLSDEESKRKMQRDLRSLYIRFKTSKENLPDSIEAVEALHPDIKDVRVNRNSTAKSRKGIEYCFIEFGSEERAEKAKSDLNNKVYNEGRLYVDFVGVKSKSGGKNATSKKMPLNPTRLHVSGLPDAAGVNEASLKKLFPRATRAIIPMRSAKKGNPFAFVQFSSPGDAKAAHDACQDLQIGGRHLTVVFARLVKNRNIKKETDNDDAENTGNTSKAQKRKTPVKKEEVKEKVAKIEIKEEKKEIKNEKVDDEESSNEGDEAEEEETVENDEESDDDEKEGGDEEDGDSDDDAEDDDEEEEDGENGDAGDDDDDDEEEDDDDEEVQNDESSDDEEEDKK